MVAHASNRDTSLPHNFGGRIQCYTDLDRNGRIAGPAPRYRVGGAPGAAVAARVGPLRIKSGGLVGGQQPVGGASDAGRPAIEHVGIDHRGRHVAVAQQLLDRPDVGTVLQQMGGEGVAEGVAAGALGDARTAYRGLHRALQDGFVQVMPAALARLAVQVGTRGGEDPLPAPLAAGPRILPGQGPG